MHCFSTCLATSFGEALSLTKQALEHHGFAVLGQTDVRKALQGYLAVDFRPYAILSVCNLKLAKAAIEADDEIGAMLLSNVVVHERAAGCVDISVVDPAVTVGSLNHVAMIQLAKELRCQLRAAIDEIEALAELRPVPLGDAVRPEVGQGRVVA
jgi:uncharacterized protein (DUF302 family)